MKGHYSLQSALLAFSFLLICLFTSCGDIYSTAKNLKLRTGFIKGHTDIRELIDIDGYYFCDSDFYSWYCSRNMLFYDDGSFSFFHWKDHDTNERYWSLAKMKIAEDSMSKLTNVNLEENIQPLFSQRWAWERLVGGAYVIEGDRIITETPCIFNFEWVLCRNYFRVVDRRTLKREVWQLVGDDSIKFDSLAVFRFIPAENPPDPDYMMAKDKKWMWKDKKEWKEAKKKRKAKWKAYRAEHNIKLYE